jgi:hypothetical protein
MTKTHTDSLEFLHHALGSNDSDLFYDISSDGAQTWSLNGLWHRTDGPAVILSDGTQQWWANGKRHRTDGPAVINPNGTQSWWANGKRHRTDGPAFVYSNGTQAWFIKGVDITDQVNAWMDAKQITWPWDELMQMEFVLIWL